MQDAAAYRVFRICRMNAIPGGVPSLSFRGGIQEKGPDEAFLRLPGGFIEAVLAQLKPFTRLRSAFNGYSD